MRWLLLVSLVWAFSFGLIKGRLAGVDPSLVALIRVALALFVFLPFLRFRTLTPRVSLLLGGIGAVQFGLMYVCYNRAFVTLAAYEVAALTIFTPIFVTLCDSALTRRFHLAALAAALLAVLGAGIIVIDKPLETVSWSGIFFVQGSNLCFALGQVARRHWRRTAANGPDHGVVGVRYAGAVAVTLPFAWRALPSLASLTVSHWLTLVYLGIFASGVCFFLWNRGAAQTRPGALAVVNNAKIPLSVACSIWVFGETGDSVRLALGSLAIVLAGVLADRRARPRAAA